LGVRLAPEDLVRTIVARVLRVPFEAVGREQRLTEIARVDSLHLLEIVSALDAALGRRLPTATLGRAVTVAHLEQLVEGIRVSS
jgi:acyl carrier protein